MLAIFFLFVVDTTNLAIAKIRPRVTEAFDSGRGQNVARPCARLPKRLTPAGVTMVLVQGEKIFFLSSIFFNEGVRICLRGISKRSFVWHPPSIWRNNTTVNW